MIKYTVASAHQTTVARSIKLGSMQVEAQVPALVVELVSEDGGMGHTFSFVGDDIPADLFTVGASIVATFQKGE